MTNSLKTKMLDLKSQAINISNICEIVNEMEKDEDN